MFFFKSNKTNIQVVAKSLAQNMLINSVEQDELQGSIDIVSENAAQVVFVL